MDGVSGVSHSDSMGFLARTTVVFGVGLDGLWIGGIFAAFIHSVVDERISNEYLDYQWPLIAVSFISSSMAHSFTQYWFLNLPGIMYRDTDIVNIAHWENGSHMSDSTWEYSSQSRDIVSVDTTQMERSFRSVLCDSLEIASFLLSALTVGCCAGFMATFLTDSLWLAMPVGGLYFLKFLFADARRACYTRKGDSNSIVNGMYERMASWSDMLCLPHIVMDFFPAVQGALYALGVASFAMLLCGYMGHEPSLWEKCVMVILMLCASSGVIIVGTVDISYIVKDSDDPYKLHDILNKCLSCLPSGITQRFQDLYYCILHSEWFVDMLGYCRIPMLPVVFLFHMLGQMTAVSVGLVVAHHEILRDEFSSPHVERDLLLFGLLPGMLVGWLHTFAREGYLTYLILKSYEYTEKVNNSQKSECDGYLECGASDSSSLLEKAEGGNERDIKESGSFGRIKRSGISLVHIWQCPKSPLFRGDNKHLAF